MDFDRNPLGPLTDRSIALRYPSTQETGDLQSRREEGGREREQAEVKEQKATWRFRVRNHPEMKSMSHVA